MGIPDYQTLMRPLLEFLGDGQKHSTRECIDALADRFHLSKEERAEMLPSGQQRLFDNRVGWARTYLKKAGLIESPDRGLIRITSRGQQVLRDHVGQIDNKYLMQFKEFEEFIQKSHKKTCNQKKHSFKRIQDNPVEQIEEAFASHQQSLIDDLLEKLKKVTPAFF